MDTNADSGLRPARAAINGAIVSRLQAIWLGTRLFRTIFFAGAAAVAGVCQYWTWPHSGDPATSQVLGIAATLVVFLAAVLAMFVERDATNEIAAAQSVMLKAENLKERYEETLRLWPDIEAFIALHQAVSLMRDQLESACQTKVDIENLISSMVTLVKRQLPAACRFSYADSWTICLYRAELDASTNRYVLRLVEHLRAVDCKKDDARKWPEGKGLSGYAFSNGQEMQIPDMTEASAQAMARAAGMERPHDFDRYRSMVIVPIEVQGQERPWGVVVATSSHVQHFNHDPEDGIKPIEAIRAIAKYAALAIAMTDRP